MNSTSTLIDKKCAGCGFKVPANLQVDKVSPATLLLEKRRQKHEVQNAFNAEKAKFKKDELDCKKREVHLREKDILI
jgi:hypothetical protein